MIVDLGANIGLSLALFSERYPEARIYGFEPAPDNFEILQLNIAACPNVQAFQVAVVPQDGRVGLINPDGQQDSYRFGGAGGSNSVEGWSMSTVIRKLGIDKIDILKIDIEGAEYELFESAQDWLGHVNTILVEVHEHEKPGVTALIRDKVSQLGMTAINFGEGLAISRAGHGQASVMSCSMG